MVVATTARRSTRIPTARRRRGGRKGTEGRGKWYNATCATTTDAPPASHGSPCRCHRLPEKRDVAFHWRWRKREANHGYDVSMVVLSLLRPPCIQTLPYHSSTPYVLSLLRISPKGRLSLPLACGERVSLPLFRHPPRRWEVHDTALRHNTNTKSTALPSPQNSYVERNDCPLPPPLLLLLLLLPRPYWYRTRRPPLPLVHRVVREVEAIGSARSPSTPTAFEVSKSVVCMFDTTANRHVRFHNTHSHRNGPYRRKTRSSLLCRQGGGKRKDGRLPPRRPVQHFHYHVGGFGRR